MSYIHVYRSKEATNIPTPHMKNAMLLPSLIAPPLFANWLVREGGRDGDIRTGAVGSQREDPHLLYQI